MARCRMRGQPRRRQRTVRRRNGPWRPVQRPARTRRQQPEPADVRMPRRVVHVQLVPIPLPIDQYQ